MSLSQGPSKHRRTRDAASLLLTFQCCAPGFVYQRIVREYPGPGRSLNHIGLDLNVEGIQTRNRSSSRWSGGAVSRILRCADECGEITVNQYLAVAKGKIIAPRPELEHHARGSGRGRR